MTEPALAGASLREVPVRVVLHQGGALAVFRQLPGDSFEGLLCDPPYGLGGEAWDREIPPPELWRGAARVLRPAAWVLAFGGRRTHHRLMAAMEAGGLEAAGNHHPTKKPVKLCAYLARLILPPGGGRLAVPFCGSGSEFLGGLSAGWREVVGVERELRWLRVAEKRLVRESPGVPLEARI